MGPQNEYIQYETMVWTQILNIVKVNDLTIRGLDSMNESINHNKPILGVFQGMIPLI